MCSHLFSLHPTIWEIVENGMHFDSMDNPVFINKKIHKKAQATTVLLASLCMGRIQQGERLGQCQANLGHPQTIT